MSTGFDLGEFYGEASSHHAVPEHYLGIAIISRAILDYVGRRTDRENRRSARAFLFSNSRRPFRFIWWCEVLGFEPDAMRDAIRYAAVNGLVPSRVVEPQ